MGSIAGGATKTITAGLETADRRTDGSARRQRPTIVVAEAADGALVGARGSAQTTEAIVQARHSADAVVSWSRATVLRPVVGVRLTSAGGERAHAYAIFARDRL